MIRKKRQILFSSNIPSETRSYFWTSNPHYHSLVPHKTAQKISMPHFFTTQVPPQHTISLPYTYLKTDHNFHYKSNTYQPQNLFNYQTTEKFISDYQPIFQQSHSFNSKGRNKNYPLLTLQNFFHSNSFLNEDNDNNNNNNNNHNNKNIEENPNSSRKQQYGIEQEELSPLKFLNFNHNKNNYNQTHNYNVAKHNEFGYRPSSLYEFHTNTKTNTNTNSDSNPYKITKIKNQTHYKQLPDKNYNYNYNYNNYTVPKSATISFRSIANQYSEKGSTTSSNINSNR